MNGQILQNKKRNTKQEKQYSEEIGTLKKKKKKIF
jgi:hypothetical protein